MPASLVMENVEPGRVYTLAEEVDVSSSSGYRRTLPRASRWESRGRVPAGQVFRRIDGILTIEGAHMHEAYLVIADGKVVGFFLPVERAFSPSTPTPIAFN